LHATAQSSTDALAAVIIKRDRILAYVVEVFVHFVVHFEERCILADIRGVVRLELA